MVNALVERWHSDTHTFHLPVSECAVTLEDMAVILGLSTNDLLVTRVTMSTHEALEAECLHQFGVAPRKSDYLDPSTILASILREPRSFPLANRWHNWECEDQCYRFLSLAHFRKSLDDLQEGQFVLEAYGVDRIELNIILADIYMDSVMWSVTVPLISFECIE
ncbi:hypothetical protein Ahy_A03g012754 [Arachis hypogaea]|uniref:Aminotransferase-like plant mobile domain-containing protein n=1 Tax=Arachis hypogaea TaxID=3818 RepID=A0A445DU16_ARAHY|nr:hypothetical protein Ahy_A03g012754 [Arachis hypogaea]